MDLAYVALGGNVGEVLAAFRSAVAALRQTGHDVVALSAAYRTRALQRPDDKLPMADYWNAVCALRPNLPPEALLVQLQALEVNHGRQPGERWSARTLDLDLLVYGREVRCSAELTLPHPALTSRNFVLLPLCELAAELILPGDDQSLAQHLRALSHPQDGVRAVRYNWQQEHMAAEGDRVWAQA